MPHDPTGPRGGPERRKAPHQKVRGFPTMIVRRRPTLPQGPPCSTIGAERLSFRVRNVTGRSPDAMTTETLGNRYQRFAVSEPHSGRETHSTPHRVCGQALGLLVPVNSTSYLASISGLSTLSSPGSLTPSRGWEPSSRSRLPA